MPITWWGLVGLFAALLINRAADCWLNPAGLQCGLTRHPRRQWLVVVALPVLFIVLSSLVENPIEQWTACFLGTILVLLAVIDIEQRRIPDIVIFPALVIGLAIGWQIGSVPAIITGVLIAAVVFLVLFGIGRHFFGPAALGMGDVKLATLLGAFFAYPTVVYALLMGIILAGIYSAISLITGRSRRGDIIPYGSFLAVSGIIVLIAKTVLGGGSQWAF
jgi:leader peptidase (prepilin peptidase) / N-methyltransferase